MPHLKPLAKAIVHRHPALGRGWLAIGFLTRHEQTEIAAYIGAVVKSAKRLERVAG